jgi:hypothetical protein
VARASALRIDLAPLLRSVALALLVWTLLRGAQWLSVAPLLHDAEWLQFADLPRALQAGKLDQLDPRQLFPRYSYMPFSQGVAITGLVSWLLAPLLGVSSWALQASSLLAEALAVALLTALLSLAVPGRAARALALAPWLLAPGLAVVWQILPFGNHTELQWVPIGVALALAWRPPERGSWRWFALLLALLSWGVFCYRGTLPVVVAFALWGLWSGSRRLLVGALAVAGSSLVLVTVILWALYGDGFSEAPDRFLMAHAAGARFARAAPLLGDQPFAFVTAPRELPQWPYLSLLLLALPLALLRCLRSGRGGPSPLLHAQRFVLLWASLAFVACLADSFPRLPHTLPALYALLVNAALLLADGAARWLRWASLLLVSLLALAGLRDGLGMIHPELWRDTARYEGLALYEQLDVRSLDGDDWLWFQRIVEQGRAHRHVGVVTHAFCSHDLRERRGLPHPQPRASLCGCEEPGWVGRVLVEAIERGPQADPFQAGRGAWIYCGRDIEALEVGLEGVSAPMREAILGGARDEREASAAGLASP